MTNNILARSGKLYLIEMPEKPICDCDEVDGAGDFEDMHYRCEQRFKKYEAAVDLAIAEALESGEFEDQERVQNLIRTSKKYKHWIVFPDGTYHVDLPRWEKVRQECFEGSWFDRKASEIIIGEYRTIVRFIK